MVLRIKRQHFETEQTRGYATLFDGDQKIFEFVTLELAWRDNQRNISCIPMGEYRAIKHASPKFQFCFWLQDVPNRSEILIHTANFYHQLRGCVAVGETFKHIDSDRFYDVTNSRITINKLISLCPEEITVRIE